MVQRIESFDRSLTELAEFAESSWDRLCPGSFMTSQYDRWTDTIRKNERMPEFF